MGDDEVEKHNPTAAAIFKALGDENRWRILETLKEGERCACVLLTRMQIGQSTLSHHMKVLCDAGLITSRRDGKWTHYSLRPEGIQAAKGLLDSLLTASRQAPSLCACTKKEETIVEGKTKLYVLTGFLGSGKTTILLKLLEQLKGHRVGVIQNEFGKLSIDGEILRDGDIKMVELNRGSIFCTCLKLSFVQGLAEMAKQNLEYLFVESSGWGDPSNLEEILAAAKELAGDVFDFQGAICLVDAVNFFDQLADGQPSDEETVYRQVKHCHLAVVTKVDLVDPQRLEAVEAKIREINPICPIEVSANANLDLSFLQKDLTQYRWAESEESTNSVETKPKTLFMNYGKPVEEETLRAFLLDVADSLLRAKGFFEIAGKGWQQVDLVGRRVDLKPCEPKEKAEMVFISRIGPAIIRPLTAAWQQHFGEPMPLKN